MILVHTEEELELAKEPAICVIGATSTVVKDRFTGALHKVYIRVCRQNEAACMRETYLFDVACGGGESERVTYDEFRKVRSRLAFGEDGASLHSDKSGIVVMELSKIVKEKGGD